MLSISIVIYKLNALEFEKLLTSLVPALENAGEQGSTTKIHIIDNGQQTVELKRVTDKFAESLSAISLISSPKNVGYGRAHNIALSKVESDYHLILNPDVELDPDCLNQGITYLDQHPETCAVSPFAEDLSGHRQYLVKKYPSILDLLLRGFAPEKLRKRFAARLNSYEQRQITDSDRPADIQIMSGCYMLCRTEVLKQVGGFDERYFLYFEDFSLSMEMLKLGKLKFLPEMKIIHLGGNAAKKGLLHIWYFVTSAIKFFNQYGWKVY